MDVLGRKVGSTYIIYIYIYMCVCVCVCVCMCVCGVMYVRSVLLYVCCCDVFLVYCWSQKLPYPIHPSLTPSFMCPLSLTYTPSLAHPTRTLTHSHSHSHTRTHSLSHSLTRTLHQWKASSLVRSSYVWALAWQRLR
jgi:hypothetical protein